MYMGETEADLQSFISKLDCYRKVIGLNIDIMKTKLIADFPINMRLCERNHQSGGQVCLPKINLCCQQSKILIKYSYKKS